MPCYQINMKNGGTAFLCGDLGPHCSAEKCGDVSGFLCDYPVGEDKACDLPLCQSHAYETAPEIHYCLGHLKLWQGFVSEGKAMAALENVERFNTKAFDLDVANLKSENKKLKARVEELERPKPIKPA